MHRATTVLIVDEEPIARRDLGRMLAARDDLVVIGDANSGEVALDMIRGHQPDILLLDARLPDMTGLDVVRCLATLPIADTPLVVFVTAFDAYALQAFDYAAADYVVKPFTDERLMRAIDRALMRQRERRAERSLMQLVAALQEVVPIVRSHRAAERGFRERFLVSVGARDAVVDTSTIAWVRANGYYATLVTEGLPKVRRAEAGRSEASSGPSGRPAERAEYLIRVSLDQLERELDPVVFLRVHRSAIVRLDCIRAAERTPRRGMTVVLEDGTRIPVSRSRRVALLRALGRAS